MKTALNLNSLMTKEQRRDYVKWNKEKIRKRNLEILKEDQYMEEVLFLREVMKEKEDGLARWLFIESKLEPTPIFSKVIRIWFPILKFPRKITGVNLTTGLKKRKVNRRWKL